jgi:RNA polymerase sigma factor (sigma-70 family)
MISMDSGFGQETDDTEDFKSVETKIDEGKFGSQRSTDAQVMEGETQDFVNRFMSAIPEKYSVILTLFYMDDLSHDEIADVLKLPIGTVKNRIFRAKEKLKEMMVSRYSEETIMEFI